MRPKLQRYGKSWCCYGNGLITKHQQQWQAIIALHTLYAAHGYTWQWPEVSNEQGNQRIPE